jgi:hypothetical protein
MLVKSGLAMMRMMTKRSAQQQHAGKPLEDNPN